MEKRQITFSVVLAEIGGIGGSAHVPQNITAILENFIRGEYSPIGKVENQNAIQDVLVTYVKNRIVLMFSHSFGKNSSYTQRFQSEGFAAIQATLKRQKLSSIEIKPAILEFDIGFNAQDKERPQESFVVIFGADCPVKIFNRAIYYSFCEPLTNENLFLNDKFFKGFVIKALNTKWENKEVSFKIPEENWHLARMIKTIDNALLKEIHSGYRPDEQISETVAGAKDFISIIRTEGSFPSLNDILKPYSFLPVIPLIVEQPFTDPYDLPTVSCLAFSVDNEKGGFTGEGPNYGGYIDVFDNPAWSAIRLRHQALAYQNRFNSFNG